MEIEKDSVQPKRKTKITKHSITKDESVGIPAKKFHRVHTVSKTPACYMYSYVNHTRQLQEKEVTESPEATEVGQKNKGVWDIVMLRLENIARAIGLVCNAILNVLYSVPMVKRVRTA